MLKDNSNWDRIPSEVYKEIIVNAKERYNEIASQSEAISKRTIQVLLTTSALLAWFTNFTFESSLIERTWFVLLFSMYTIFLYYWLINLLLPRSRVLQGTSPKEALEDEDDISGNVKGENYGDADKIRVYYYREVERYYNRTNKFAGMHNERAKKYRTALVLSFLYFISIILAIVITKAL